MLVEAAWSAVAHHPFWKAQFERLVPSLGKGKAIVAIARKLLVVVWASWARLDPSGGGSARRPAYGDPQTAALGASHGLATSAGLSRGTFAQQVLDRLGLGGGETLVAQAGAGT